MARVLVVEDNAINMKLVMLLLHSGGHETLSAVDAESGIAEARSQLPDVILMDIQLPKMDGLTATGILKSDARTAHIPVVALTALAMKEDEEKSRMAGCDAYIAKPLNRSELFEVVDSLLSARVSRRDEKKVSREK